MRILFCVAGLPAGGGERQFLRLVQGAARAGHEIQVHVFGRRDRAHYREVFDLPCPVHFSEVGPGMRLRAPWIILRDLRRLCRESPPDLLFGMLFKASVAVRLAKALGLTRAAVVTTMRTDFMKVYGWTTRLQEWALQPWNDGWVTNHRPTLALMRPYLGGRARYVPNGIAPEDMPDGGPKPPAAGRPLRLLCVGQMRFAYKGQDRLVEALALLRARRPALDFHLACYGHGVDQERLAAQVAARGLSAFVQIHAPVADLAPVYARADALVHPARIEGTPNVVVEAMLAGTPVLASAYVGALGVVGAGGLIATGDDAEALAEVIERFADMDDDGRAALADAARHRARTAFTTEAMVAGHLRAFQEAARNRAVRPLVVIGPVPPPVHGLSAAVAMLLEELDRRGLPYRLIDIAPKDAARKDGGFAWGRVASLLGPFRRALALAWRPRSTVYLTLAQSWAGFLRDWVFIHLAWIFRHRLVLHLHGGNYDGMYAALAGWKRPLVRWTLGRAERILILGPSLGGMFDFAPALRDRIGVVLNGLPPAAELHAADAADAAASPAPRAAKSLPPDPAHPVRLLYLSNLIESKGYLTVLEAVRILRDRGDAVRADFAGCFLLAEGSTYATPEAAEADFHARVAAAGLEAVVHWHGVVRGAAKARLLAEAHFLALPTRYTNEGQPLCVIESMAHGVVPLVTRYRSLPDLIGPSDPRADGAASPAVLVGTPVPEGEAAGRADAPASGSLEEGSSGPPPWAQAGAYVETDRPETLADAILAYRAEPERYHAASAAGLARYRAFFTREAHLRALLAELYKGNPPEAIP